MKSISPNGPKQPPFGPDPLVVLREELCAVLDVWVRAQDIRAKEESGRHGRGDGVIGGLQMLAAQTGLHVDSVHSVVRRDRARYVGLNIADLLLRAVGETSALRDGRIQVLPNPRWSAAGWEREMLSRGVETVEGIL